MVKNTDLHTHTHYSTDSDISPKDLVIEAKNIGIKHLAITDHDSVAGIPEALIAGKEQGIDIIPGVELHSKFGEVLGYFIDYKNEDIIKLCKHNNNADNVRAIKMIELLNKDFKLDPELMRKKYNSERLTRPIIAKEMVSKGYAKDFRDAFDSYLTTAKYHVEVEYFSTEEVIKIIVSAGGVAILAHPYFEDYNSEFENIKLLIKAGLAGMECSNIKDNLPENYDNVIIKIKELAKKHNLILTCGSDYHGTTHKANILGSFNCDEEVVFKIKELAKNK